MKSSENRLIKQHMNTLLYMAPGAGISVLYWNVMDGGGRGDYGVMVSACKIL